MPRYLRSDVAALQGACTDRDLQPGGGVLGHLFLLACVAAALSIAAIFFVLYGPVPVKRRVMVVPRLPVLAAAPAPTLVAQLAPARQQVFTPAAVTVVAPPPTPLRKPMGAKVQPLPRKRSARGSEPPFAPVVRRRPREEDVATNPVRIFDAEELTIDERY